ncbi:hypothetical protein [Streptomyces sp. NBC_01716]|uniref:hypothetical protein n=1 Tax=Streptomyces sp. NBC_01716 TaxID=2975917 RepID=UPI002E3122A0|nr:hypothetical protein [Streptomyces sp. NBC_01716]
MSRKKSFSPKKKIALLVGAAALVGGTAVAMTGTSQASVECDGLNTALGNNQRFIDGQRAAPDALSEARIANRQDVIEEIKRKQAASGCEVGASDTGAAPPAPPAGDEGAGEEAGAGAGEDAGAGAGQAGQVGEVVCAGSTVTLSGEAGAPAASSNEFPVGTTLKVTNLDNNKSTTVQVTAPSGSCALLNDAAFEQVREPGKFLIRNARIERVG